ncbi:hypothetical protein [Synechococcus sp. WH 8016]|uniref:hypothetical protein n=1 Tax=Synechococcus sp. WH 8016 TaxID=166318 RepID=UPI00022D9EC3|nr:hypothetical protein [Synechococcus sp. WH 8016]EHA60523.1 hypothetical protein Syn8016DRAFT_2310 [Synechococcus sp. WH 8016]
MGFALFLAWIITALLCAIVAADKNHNGTAWGFAGLLLGPLALIATVGLSDRRQHQLLRKISDALSGEQANNANIDKPELILEVSEPEGPIEGADDYNACVEIWNERGTYRRPVYAKSIIDDKTICLMDEGNNELARFKKDRSGKWTMPFWQN